MGEGGVILKRLWVLAPLAIVACSDNGAQEAADPVFEPAATIDAGDFSELELGAKIVGPVGEEVAGQLAVGGRVIADIVSYVACPALTETCDPYAQPEGTIYTYVHQVTPVGVAGDDGVTPFGFRTMMTASGFTGVIGFDRAQAATALGEIYTVDITGQGGVLVWALQSDDAWSDGEEMVFFWQSTQPPAGPAEAYALETIAGDAVGTGPFPGG